MNARLAWLPNALTLGRIAAALSMPVAYWIFRTPTADWVALALFTLAAMTDWLDGWTARTLDAISETGRALDPIADKILVCAALICLLGVAPAGGQTLRLDAAAGAIAPNASLMTAATLILARDLAISGLRERLATRGATLPVIGVAKLKTALLLAALGLLLLHGALSTPAAAHARDEAGGIAGWAARAPIESAGHALLWLAALLSTATGVHYAARAHRLMTEERP